MTTLRLLATITPLLIAGGMGVVAWIRWHRWLGDEQDTRLLTGIVDLRRRFRDGDVDGRLPAKGRGFARDVETAVNRLLDEAVVHLRARRAEATALADALDRLGGVVRHTVEQLETTAGQVEGLAVQLERKAALGDGGTPLWRAVESLRAGDERFAAHCQTAATLAESSRSAATRCHGALEQLRATLGDLTREMAGTGEGVRALRANWAEFRAGLDGFRQAAGTTEVLAVNATLAARREVAHLALERFAAEADAVAHDAARALTRVTGVAADCEDRLARLATADDAERRLGVAATEASELDGALRRIHDLPPSLAAFATELSGLADTRAQVMTSLSGARPEAAGFTDELRTWTALAHRVGSLLTDAAGMLTAARRDAQHSLEKEVSA